MNGRKRFIAVDSLGLIWSLVVTAANVQDRDIGSWLLGGLRCRLVWVREGIADAGFSKRFVEWVERWCGWAVVTTHNAPEGFRIHPRRWVVARTFAWLGRYRRPGKDYEVDPDNSEAMISAAMIHRMVRGLHPGLPHYESVLSGGIPCSTSSR